MINADIAYLLGMIVGKGEIRRNNRETQVLIGIPHKSLKIEDENTQRSVKASLLDITQRLRELIGANLQTDISNNNVAILHFTKPNGDFLIRTLNNLLNNKVSWRVFRIPKEIFNKDMDTKKEFLRGLADVTGHIRKSNSAYGQPFNHRVYIEVMENWDLAVDIANLLKTLNIPVQHIRWAHPNFVDPKSKFYKKGATNTYKEHQIKIWAEEFEKIGFSIDHKVRLLKKYTDLNKKNWDKKAPIGEKHHKFYWETKPRTRIKLPHPDEDNPRIHPKIRGKHFDSWKEIAQQLGYHE